MQFFLSKQFSFFDKMLVRSIWMAIKAFQNIDQLICFVEKIRKEEPEPSLTEAQSKYFSFFNLAKNATNKNRKPDMDWIGCFLREFFQQKPYVCALFKTMHHQRFLMDLAYEHALILEQGLRPTQSIVNHSEMTYSLGFTDAYINHACLPNVIRTHKNGFIVWRTIRPIKRNEQLFVTYIGNTTDIFPLREMRQEELKKKFKFNCICELCNDTVSISMGRLRMDPDYAFITKALSDWSTKTHTLDQIEELKKKCLKFLTQHGWEPLYNETVYVNKVLYYLMAHLH